MKSRALFAFVVGVVLISTLIVIVVIPGVERGGWLEVLAVLAAVVLFAVGDRWLRRFLRR